MSFLTICDKFKYSLEMGDLLTKITLTFLITTYFHSYRKIARIVQNRL